MKTIVYLNPDYFTDTDLTVLKYLAKEYKVVWFYIHESIKNNNYITVEQASEYAKNNGLELKVVDPKLRHRNPKNIFFYINVVREINIINPDLVFSCLRDPYWVIAEKLFLKCTNVVLGIHDVKLHSSERSILYVLESFVNNLIITTHRYFVTFSRNQQKLLNDLFGKKSCMVGMSCKDFGKSDLIPSDISKKVKLLFFGGIHKYKGLDLLITELEKLWQKGYTNMSLTIAGNGNYWKYCESLVKTKEIYNLKIHFIDNKDIPDLMSSHHFLVLPYRDATQSGPLATAEAYELPIIAPNFGCFADTYSSESAILYPQGHLDEALIIVSNLTNDKYMQMKHACRKVKDNNSEESIAKNYIQYFNSLMDKKTSTFNDN